MKLSGCLQSMVFLFTAAFLMGGLRAQDIEATNNLGHALLSFPSILAWDYRPDLAIESANAFISAGEGKAYDFLFRMAKQTNSSFAETRRINRNISYLCRLLFLPTNSNEILHPPRIGAFISMPYESMFETNWPTLPFEIVNDVPLSMQLGIAGGIPESAERYLEYCKANGRFRDHPFPTPTIQTVSNAMTQAFESPKWRSLKWKDPGGSYELDEESAKESLWRQVENMQKGSSGEK
jgi:hypothetical protein